MKSILARIAILSIATLIFSCQKEKDAPPLIAKKLSSLEVVVENNGNFDKIAKQLAVALRQKDMRVFIKNEASKKFDGDFDILFKNVQNVSVGGKAFKNHLVDKSKNSMLTLENIAIISEGTPLLNISVPVNIDKWDAETFTPLVAIVPDDYDDKTATKIKAYDADGKIHWLDANTAPNFPVVVVSENERTEIKNSEVVLKYKSGTSSSKKRIFNINTQMVLGDPIEDGGGGGGGEVYTCYRTDGQWEYMNALIFPDNYLQSQYEDWILGAPEIKISIFKPVENFTKLGLFSNTYYEPVHRSDVNNDWDHFYGGWQLYMWFTADYGNIVLYKMIEEDDGDEVEYSVSDQFEIPNTTQTVTLTGKSYKQERDDEGPTVPVDFRDTRCERIYGDPSFKFHLTNQ